MLLFLSLLWGRATLAVVSTVEGCIDTLLCLGLPQV